MLLSRRLPSLCRSLCLFLVFFAACGDDSSPIGDASVDVPIDVPIVSRQLTLVTQPSIALIAGDRAMLEVRLTEGEEPVPAEFISFALIGVANDSSLESLEVQTDLEGYASTAIVAGSAASSFRVRASAMGSTPVAIDVAISDMGFGTLQVILTYPGERRGELSAAFHLVESCDDERTRLDRFRAEHGMEVMFENVPAGVPLAVTGRLDGEALVALGCVDGISVEHGETRRIEIELNDLPLEATGVYDAELSFVSPEVVDHYKRELGEMVEAVTLGAYLDAFRYQLARDQQADFDARRDQISAELLDSWTSWRQASGLSNAFDALVERAFVSSRVYGALRVGGESSFSALEIGGNEWRAPSPNMPTQVLTSEWNWETSELALGRVRLPLSAGQVLGTCFEHSRAHEESATSWVSRNLGCDSAPMVSLDCAGDCEISACSELASDIARKIEALGSQSVFAELVLSGIVRMMDDNVDLLVESGDATLDVAWIPSSAVEGALTLRRRPPSQTPER